MNNRCKPNLFFDEEELIKLRLRIKNGKRSVVILENAIYWCERFIDKKDNFYFDYRERISEIWKGRQGNFIIPHRLLTLALTGCVADRNDFCREAAMAFMEMVDHRISDQLGEYRVWRNSPNHDSGKYYFMIALLYDLLVDYWDDEQRRRVISHVDETFECSRKIGPEAYKYRDNNQGNRFLAGQFLMCLAFQDLDIKFSEDARRIAYHAPAAIENYLRFICGRDGVPVEGASYGQSNMHFFYLVSHAFERKGLGVGTKDKRYEKLVDFVVQETLYHEGWVNNFGDCDKVKCSQLMYILGVDKQLPVALWNWDLFAMKKDHPFTALSTEEPGKDFNEVPWALLWPDDQACLPEPPDREYPLNRFFQDRGLVSIRSGFDHSSMHATLFSGKKSCMHGHFQADINQITFYALGENFLIDSGYFKKDKPAEGLIKNGVARDSEYHNLILVDGVGQVHPMNQDGWGMGEIMDFQSSHKSAYVLGNAQEAYLGTANRCERHLYVNMEKDRQFAILVDDMDCDGSEHDYTLLLHTDQSNTFRINKSLVVIEGKECDLELHLHGSNKIKIEQDICDQHPRLRISMRAIRAQFVILMYPRKKKSDKVIFDAKIKTNEIETLVKLGGDAFSYRFDTNSRKAWDRDENKKYFWELVS